MAQDRVYINQCSLREKVFDNGGSLINAAFKVSELQEHADENGWVNLVIAKRREVSEKGARFLPTFTHFGRLVVPPESAKISSSNCWKFHRFY